MFFHCHIKHLIYKNIEPRICGLFHGEFEKKFTIFRFIYKKKMQLGLVTTLDITVGNLHVRQNYGKFACATEIISNIMKTHKEMGEIIRFS